MMSITQLVTMLLFLAAEPVVHPVWGAEQITEAVELTDVDPLVLLAISLHESNLNPRAVGKAGETGPWQVHPVHRDSEYRVACRTFPENCAAWHVQTAARILRKGLETCGGDLKGALAYYNRGHGCKGRNQYVAGVMRELSYLRELQNL